nr:MAG: helix-turn-helix domain protein [Bacteriophage sp.]UVM91506.1 MAG: helix-turn-helix domain protein [Bacteriophage sp.]UVM94726.1 MAG: helix-turn-helix domain protein [Bacteriophage sp.]UVM95755.1 MAG: helix-turn-helix domain protein [Bacteriophage sp.]UVN08658.1 MAG: helix-turn-helix domain protein [Bacteriophage sp.]
MRKLPLRYKIDVLAALKEAGYSSYRLRKEKLLSESTLQKLRDGIIVSTDVIEQLCGLLNCQPGDLLEHKAE